MSCEGVEEPDQAQSVQKRHLQRALEERTPVVVVATRRRGDRGRSDMVESVHDSNIVP